MIRGKGSTMRVAPLPASRRSMSAWTAASERRSSASLVTEGSISRSTIGGGRIVFRPCGTTKGAMARW